MNQEKIKKFKELLENGDTIAAVKLIPEILTYDQYMSFCKKASAHCMNKSYSTSAYKFELAENAAFLVQQREQELLAAETDTKLAEEQEGFKRTVFEDAEASFEIMSEKAADFCDPMIIEIAFKEME